MCPQESQKLIRKSFTKPDRQKRLEDEESVSSEKPLDLDNLRQNFEAYESQTSVKYEYRFNTETITIQVDHDDIDILLEFDRMERNLNQKETRRHASFEAFNLDGNLFASEEDLEAEYIQNETYQSLYDAIDQLLPQQKSLIIKVYFENRSLVSIANEEGVGESSIRDRLKRIYKKIKENLK